MLILRQKPFCTPSNSTTRIAILIVITFTGNWKPNPLNRRRKLSSRRASYNFKQTMNEPRPQQWMFEKTPISHQDDLLNWGISKSFNPQL